jgi:senataxin
VSTVDAFQGAEKDVVILSTCGQEFGSSPPRLNVALTRARRHLICLGHVATAQKAGGKWEIVVGKNKIK